MSPVFFGLVGMFGIGLINILIALLNRKNDSFKVELLILKVKITKQQLLGIIWVAIGILLLALS